jgi:4-aminobutyrate aminotransferase/(S)-3-amino-2-methylpropionate transaminase
MAIEVTGSQSESLRAGRDRYVARGVSVQPIFADRAHGATLVDVDGREYIDFAGGIGVVNLGHTPEAVVAAIKEQADRLLHSCFMVAGYEPYVEVCRLLAELTPGSDAKKAVLVNSGAEAVENAVKIARYHTGRPAVIAFDRGFHGRTLLTMSLTSKLVYKRGMGPFAPEVYRAPAPYPYRGIGTDEALEGLRFAFKAHVDPASVACVILEAVQGEGGFVVMPPDFIRGVKELCEQHGILYVDDEIQAGMGRTGALWAIEHSGVVPDLITVGKSVASGMPLAAVVGRAEVVDSVHPGGLGGTYGGNPLACAAALGAMETMREQDLAAAARAIGDTMLPRLRALQERTPAIGDVRGRGAMVAVELVLPGTTEPEPALTAQVARLCHAEGVVVLTAGTYGNVLRFLPPLVIGQDLLAEALDVLDAAFAAATTAVQSAG